MLIYPSKKKTAFLFFFSFFFIFTICAQNLLFNSGESVMRMDFSGDEPVVSTLGFNDYPNAEPIAHAEDADGNLLFVASSIGVYRADGTIMPSSVDLTINASCSEMTVCPVPGEASQYYIFYIQDQYCDPLNYTIIDMALDGGLGDILELNVLLDSEPHAEGIEIVRIPDMDEYWLLSYRCSEGIDRYKIDADGIGDPEIILPYTVVSASSLGATGELEYHMGKIAKNFSIHGNSILADFDPETGTVSNTIELENSFSILEFPYGAEFSLDGSKFYYTSDDVIKQYDIETEITTEYVPDVCDDGITIFGQIEMAPSGDLYVTRLGANCTIKIENASTTSPVFVAVPMDAVMATGISNYIQSEILPDVEMLADIKVPKCHGDFSGSINVTVTFGEAPFELEWSHDPTETSLDIDNLPAGSYTLYITDAIGLTGEVTFVVEEPDALLLDLNVIQPGCFGDFGFVELDVQGGSPPYTIQWNGVDPEMIAPGDYTVIVTDAHQCSESMAYSIDEKLELFADVQATAIECYGGFSTLSIEMSGGSPPYSINWNGVNPEMVLAGTYPFDVVDANGCVFEGTYLLEQSDSIEIELEIDQPDCNQMYAIVRPYISGGLLPYELNWFAANPDYLIPGEYVLEVKDANGCVEEYSYEFVPEKEKLFIPAAFTPNNDGLNDVFLPQGDCYLSYEISIYDRWGKLIFEGADNEEAWDGTYKGEALGPAVFVYELQLINTSLKAVKHSGHVALIR